MAEHFSALQELGDRTRLRVFLCILGARKNVSQIVAELGLAQPQVSYHLRKLKQAGLAVEEKDGRWVWYQADWDSPDRNVRDFIALMARWAEDVGEGPAPGEGPATGEGAAAGEGKGPGGPSGGRRSGAESVPEPEAVAATRSPRPVVRRTRGPGILGRRGGGCSRAKKKLPPEPARETDSEGRPVVRRPEKRDSDLDDFLL